jgi:hypothetical protein
MTATDSRYFVFYKKNLYRPLLRLTNAVSI